MRINSRCKRYLAKRIIRFNGTDIPEQIFNEILKQAISYDLVGGKVLYSDSNHLKANANKNKYVENAVKVESQDYISDLNNAINADRIAHGKKPLKFEEYRTVTPEEDDNESYFDDNNGSSGTPSKGEKKVKASTTYPDSGFMRRDGQAARLLLS